MFLLTLFVSLSTAAATDYQISTRAIIDVPNPAFQTLVGSKLLVSSFRLVGRDAIYGIDLGSQNLELITDEIVWPNEIQHLDAGILGEEGLLIASGFLFPGKRTGALSFLSDSGLLTTLTQEKQNYFYHRAVLADVSGTGRLDILTARGTIPFYGQAMGELVWLKRPEFPLVQAWPEVVLAKGPDMQFRVARNPADGALVVVAAEYLARRLAIYWIDGDGQVHSRTIDNTLGHGFDLEFTDLNNDGIDDLLVTNHESEARKSAVYAYVLPANYKTGSWSRKTLLTGIETRQPGFNSASPGAARAFVPETARAGFMKPWIIVSGDGSQRAHLLRPRSEDPSDWDYAETIVLDVPSTIGEPLVADFDGDGFADISIPAYDTGKLYLLSVRGKEKALFPNARRPETGPGTFSALTSSKRP